MSLHLPPAPVAAQAALAGLGKFGVKPGEYKAVGVPIYDATPAELLDGKGPAARAVAVWRFLILAGDDGHETAVRTADTVRLAGARRYTLATATAVGAGDLLNGLTAAADPAVTTDNLKYTVRLAQFPGLAVLAVWLDAPRPADDVFLPLPPEQPGLRSLLPVARREFLDYLTPIARRKVEPLRAQ